MKLEAHRRTARPAAISRIMLGVCALATLALLLPSDAAAMQFNATVRGKLTDEAGNPMEGVTVIINLLTQLEGREVAPIYVETDENGNFNVRNVRLGYYEILFEKEGYVTHTEKRELRTQPYRFDITMVEDVAAAGIERANIANAEYTAGYEAFTAGNFREAISRMHAALPSVDDTEETIEARGFIFALIGRSHFELRQFEEAAAAYTEWLKYAPDDPDPHIELGHALNELGDNEGAQNHFQQALAMSPDDAATLYNAGIMMVNAGSVEDGIGFIERAIEVQPEYPMAHKNIGYAYARVEEFAKAVQAFETYLEQSPDAEDAAQIQDFINLLKEMIG